MHQSRATGVRGVAPRSRSRTGRRPSSGQASGGGGKSKLSDELGYASGDCERRITVDFASCRSRHGKYNLRGRAERLSSARDSVHTRASRYGGLGFETRAARARGVPFHFCSRDGDAFVRRHPARRETHCARWRGWGFVAKETGERSRMRMRSLDRSVGRSPSSEYACRFRQMRIRAARKTPTNGTLSEDPRRRRRRRREPSDVFAVGVMAARGVDPVTTPAPRGTSVAKR
jgi:hypothetical protein